MRFEPFIFILPSGEPETITYTDNYTDVLKYYSTRWYDIFIWTGSLFNHFSSNVYVRHNIILYVVYEI